MTYQFRKFEKGDYIRIRDFIVDNYAKNQKINSWLIDRWEFVPYYCEFRQDTLKQWEERIGIWEDGGGNIKAVACTDDNAFFLLDTLELDKDLLDILFNYAQTHLAKGSEDKKESWIGIPHACLSMEEYAIKNGYEKTQWLENFTSIELTSDFPVIIPEGFKLKSGDEVSYEARGLAHVIAFNYPDDPIAEGAIKYFYNIQNAPDYRKDLDICIVNENGDVVSFCILWYDEKNQIAILEPVGTHKDYRFRGLAKAAIYEGLNRVRSYGCKKVYVGSIQPFYLSIGFKLEQEMCIWRKNL